MKLPETMKDDDPRDLTWFIANGFSVDVAWWKRGQVAFEAGFEGLRWGRLIPGEYLSQVREDFDPVLRLLQWAADHRLVPMARALNDFKDPRLEGESETIVYLTCQAALTLNLKDPYHYGGDVLQRLVHGPEHGPPLLQETARTGRTTKRILEGLAKFKLTRYQRVIFWAHVLPEAKRMAENFRFWAKKLGLEVNATLQLSDLKERGKVHFEFVSDLHKLQGRRCAERNLLIANHFAYGQ